MGIVWSAERDECDARCPSELRLGLKLDWLLGMFFPFCLFFAGPSSFLPTVCRYSVREHRAFFESYRLALFPLLLNGIDSRAARLFCIDF